MSEEKNSPSTSRSEDETRTEANMAPPQVDIAPDVLQRPARKYRKWVILLVLMTLAYHLSVLGWEHRVKVNGEDALKEIFGAEAFIDDVDISILSGTIRLRGIRIANPTTVSNDKTFAYTLPYFLKIEEITAEFSRATILNSSLEIEKANLKRPVMYAVQSLETIGEESKDMSNLLDIVNRLKGYMEELLNHVKETPPECQVPPSAMVMTVEVHDATLNVSYHGYKTIIPLTDQILASPSAENRELPVKESIVYVTATYIKQAQESILKTLPEHVVITRTLGAKLIEHGPKMIDKAKAKASELKQKATEKTKELWQKTKNLFN